VLWWSSHDGTEKSGHSAAGSASPSQAPKAPPLDAAAGKVLAAGLRSGDESALRAVVVVPAGQAISERDLAGFTRLRSITFDPVTFRDAGDGTATVTARVVGPHGHAATWRAYLIAVDGRWKLAATAPATS
jgi:hypothetical protein